MPRNFRGALSALSDPSATLADDDLVKTEVYIPLGVAKVIWKIAKANRRALSDEASFLLEKAVQRLPEEELLTSQRRTLPG